MPNKTIIESNIHGSRPTAALLALFLVLSITVTMFALPAANAHTPPWTVSTYAFLNVAPNPVGVGQTTYINFWLDKVPPTAAANYGMIWHNMTVTMTKPDGTTQVLGPLNSDAVGGTWTHFVPDQVGTYKFVGHFPGQIVVLENPSPISQGFLPTGTDFINDTYTGSTSNVVTLEVQQQQVKTAYPSNPLPTGYWQRPINSMNREWSSIAGNWLGLAAGSFAGTGQYDSNGNFNPYTTAPDSAHVLWTKSLAFGGQIGGEFGAAETSLYATGTAYEPKFAPVILYGTLYYTSYPGAANNRGPLTAVDLRTGQTLWTLNATNPLAVGMVCNFISGDQYGAHAYLFTGPEGGLGEGFVAKPNPVWSMYDAKTGQGILDIANASAGTLVAGPSGEILSYTVAGGNLTMWNSSLCIAVGSTANNIYMVYNSAQVWRPPQGAKIDWNGGNQWSVPIATRMSSGPISPSLGVSKISDGVILLTAVGGGGAFGVPGGSQTGYRVDAGYSAVDGHLLWGPINRTLTPWTNVVLGPAGEDVYTEYTEQSLTWIGYSVTTGTKLWGPTQPYNSTWGYYGSGAVIGYGNLYTWTIGGEVVCFNVQTGALKWSWNAGSAGYDTPYGAWPFWTLGGGAGSLADGKLYLASSHDYTPPVYKGAKLYCINATTGKEIWSTLDFGGTQGNDRPIADGILVSYNCYDNQIYAYGQGLTATTVTTSSVIGNSNSVLIKGTVTDQSPGQTCLGIPAAGTPAISDASMSAWMEYLYQQQPEPMNATGVPVTLTALDPNGNTEVIGTVTSDAAGMYKTMWTPPVPGAYTIIATFAGTNSYYGSSAETAIGVASAAAHPSTTTAPSSTPSSTGTPTPSSAVSPSVAPTPTQPASSSAPSTTLYIIAAIAVIVIVAVVAAAVVLRRRRK